MARLLFLLFVTGCAASSEQANESAAQPGAQPPPVDQAAPDPLLDDVSVEQQERQVLAKKYYEVARRHWQRGELADARIAIRRVRALDPDHADARALERQIEVGLGNRSVSAEMLAIEHASNIEVRRGEELATIRRNLRNGDRAMQEQRWETAQREYERALHLIQISPFRAESEFREAKDLTNQKMVGAREPASRK